MSDPVDQDALDRARDTDMTEAERIAYRRARLITGAHRDTPTARETPQVSTRA